MDIVTISFSQNNLKELNNSSQIAQVIEYKTKQQVRHLDMKDYDVVPCRLCGDCCYDQLCAFDLAFNTLLKDIGNPDIIFLIIPYYSPFPSKLMIFLEKLNELFYASWIRDKSYKSPFYNTPIALIVHGGMVDNEEVQKHYKRMINEPLAHTLLNLQFQIIQDNQRYKNGIAFGLESGMSIKKKDNQIFPEVNHTDQYISEKIELFVQYVLRKINS